MSGSRWLCMAAFVLGSSFQLVAAPKESDDNDYYKKHIIAVDKDGSAMRPNVRRWKTKKPDGSLVDHFKASPKKMDGELLEKEVAIGADGKLKLRQEYYDYIADIVENIRKKNPKRIVFYIHGGMNFIDGAVEKGAQLAEDMRDREHEEYRISICWSSNLFSTYGEHLFANNEGLNNPVLAPLMFPLTLLSDVGGAVADAPRSLIRMLTNDIHAARPKWFKRDRHAYERQSELEMKPGLKMEDSIAASMGADERAQRKAALAADSVAWTATLPLKIATVPIIDNLGSGAWQMMLRRTRTMFERETSIITNYTERRKKKPPVFIVEVDETNRPAPVMTGDGTAKVISTDETSTKEERRIRDQIARNEQIDYAGRLGAVRLFFEKLEESLVLKGPSKDKGGKKPSLTLIGHSMGAIVSNEILARFSGIDFDHIVYLAAACTVNDFVRAGVPYLRQHCNARFYNLCLQPTAERAEAQPGRIMIFDPWYFPLEVAPRGSLLVWIDSYFDHPESEGDRTLGRWENAVLVSDAIPKNIVHRITLKAFGRERGRATVVPNELDESVVKLGMPNEGSYTTPPERRTVRSGGLNQRIYLAEPQQHGDFSRFAIPESPNKPNFAFTSSRYRKAESAKASEAARRAAEKLRK